WQVEGLLSTYLIPVAQVGKINPGWPTSRLRLNEEKVYIAAKGSVLSRESRRIENQVLIIEHDDRDSSSFLTQNQNFFYYMKDSHEDNYSNGFYTIHAIIIDGQQITFIERFSIVLNKVQNVKELLKRELSEIEYHTEISGNDQTVSETMFKALH
ncbi:hypothetical protein E2I00_007415, partial [Balaenoptera physalus]